MNQNNQPPISKSRLKNFRRKIKDLSDQELGLRAQMKHLYDEFALDALDSEVALRHVRQAYFEIQKYRMHEQLVELMEFHPFFSIDPRSSNYFHQFDEDDEDERDDDCIL